MKKEKKLKEKPTKEKQVKEATSKKSSNKKTESKINIRQSFQSFSPIKDFKQGIVLTKDNRYIKILEFSPINFGLRSSKEQEAIIYEFASLLKQSQ